ncbi:SDR family oxidoreductase [Kitasatospora sp. NPDC007106]|uniref:SDR family oxidoreductase n=1 Tax=Kitasatospora sp. NPDC007106 TaxID=3156914 RepID=UPI003407B22E
MKITVLGTGLIGSQLATELRARGHEVTAASLSSGVDLLTGAGLDTALAGADAVVNVTNSPTFDEQSIEFFRTTVGNLLAAGERAGVRHQLVLSIVGVDQVPELDYYRAKALQEELLCGGPTPYSIVRATQFFEFMEPTMSWTSDETTVRLPATLLQPIASRDIVDVLADVATGTPLGGILEIAGPDTFTLDEIGRMTLAARGDRRPVVVDNQAGLFAAVHGNVLTPGPGARLAPTRYQDWLNG